MHPFVSAASGGALIGLSAVLLMFLSGRIAGISGIVGGLLPPTPAKDWPLRLAFIAGLLLAPFVLRELAGFDGIGAPTVGLGILIPAGLLVGAGSSLGNGCTSGHGICGIARLSVRSVLATGIFVASAMVTVFLMRHVIMPPERWRLLSALEAINGFLLIGWSTAYLIAASTRVGPFRSGEHF